MFGLFAYLLLHFRV